jgi:hypothetical protein
MGDVLPPLFGKKRLFKRLEQFDAFFERGAGGESSEESLCRLFYIIYQLAG